MKIKIFVTTIIILIIGILLSIGVTNRNKQILYLSNGETIEATKIWVALGDVYYEQEEGTLFTLKENEVDKIVSTSSFTNLNDWKTVLVREIKLKKGIFKILLDKKVWAGCFLFFIMYCAFVFAGHLKAKKKKYKKEEINDEHRLITIPVDPNSNDTQKIIFYFLNLYLQQVKAKKPDKFQFKRLDNKGPGKTSLYELKIYHDDKWQFRRMSLGRIGEDSGARSKCFYAIFDDHIVIKIPPEPVNNFDEYINKIKADKKIADCLAPRECLVPKVSTVLKKIPSFVDIIGTYDKENEQKSIDGLNRFPEYQQFLKIGEHFAFFMDLSKHFFLGLILDELHNANDEISHEIKEHQDIIWNTELFEKRYGEKASNICFDLQHAFKMFEKKFNDTAIQSYQKKEWFSDCLCKGETDAKQKDIPGEALEILKEIKKEHKNTFCEYEAFINNFALEKSFRRNISQIQSICTNLVELLAWLHFKNVAMRDLKPDNLLVVGDPSKYPHFLKSADDFRIGLIDVETSVYINPKSNTIDQPKIGLTPLYATPSHMFLNKLLGILYADPRYILKLQDWQAIVGMIYETVTGEHLFKNSAGTIRSITKEIPGYFGDINKLVKFSMSANARFWADAAKEFISKIQKKQKFLKSVRLEIGTNAKQMFENAAAKSNQKDIQTRLMQIKSDVSAYEILYIMFSHLHEMMCKKEWK